MASDTIDRGNVHGNKIVTANLPTGLASPEQLVFLLLARTRSLRLKVVAQVGASFGATGKLGTCALPR